MCEGLEQRAHFRNRLVQPALPSGGRMRGSGLGSDDVFVLGVLRALDRQGDRDQTLGSRGASVTR